MKNIHSTLLTIASLLFATSLFADTNANKNNGYYSSQHPLTSSPATKNAALFPPTDITVTNASSSVIYVIIPNTSIFDTLFPNSEPDHIRNNNGAYNTTIVLQDSNQNYFFNQVVCPRALVTIYGNQGAYKVNVDSEYCY